MALAAVPAISVSAPVHEAQPSPRQHTPVFALEGEGMPEIVEESAAGLLYEPEME